MSIAEPLGLPRFAGTLYRSRGQTWRLAQIGPFYAGRFNLRQIRPGDGVFAVLDLHANVFFIVDHGQGRLFANDHLGRRCEYIGAYTQAGRLGSFAGNFTCGAGRDGVAASAGTFEMTQVEVTANGITPAVHTLSDALEQSGRFAALRP